MGFNDFEFWSLLTPHERTQKQTNKQTISALKPRIRKETDHNYHQKKIEQLITAQLITNKTEEDDESATTPTCWWLPGHETTPILGIERSSYDACTRSRSHDHIYIYMYSRSAIPISLILVSSSHWAIIRAQAWINQLVMGRMHITGRQLRN